MIRVSWVPVSWGAVVRIRWAASKFSSVSSSVLIRKSYSVAVPRYSSSPVAVKVTPTEVKLALAKVRLKTLPGAISGVLDDAVLEMPDQL